MNVKTAARYGALAVLVISGLVAALRMRLGPFVYGPVRVTTPLNPEGWFGLAVTILLVLSAIPNLSEHAAAAQKRHSVPWKAILVAALIAFITISFWRTLDFYFLSDDFVLVNLPGRFQFGMRPLFTTAGGDGFFRPIGYISLAWTSMWAGVNPVRWHATSLAMHGANVVLVFLLATRLSVSRLAAFFAAMLFAIHGTRPEAVTWIAGRFDLVASFFVLAGLLFFIQGQNEASPLRHFSRAASLAFMVLAILSKESAYIFPLLLIPVLIANREPHRRQIAPLIPFFVTVTALFAYRLWLFNGIGGYRDSQTGEAQALRFGLATIKGLGLRMWTALYFPINWSTEPAAWLAVLILVYMGTLYWLTASRPNRALIIAGVGFTVISAIPPLHLLGIGAGLANSRLLYLPSVGFCITLAAAVDGLQGRGRWIAPGVILLFHLAALQHNLNQWGHVSDKARAATGVAVHCIGPDTKKITEAGVPGTLMGVPFFGNVSSDHLQFVLSVQHGTACPLRLRSPSAKLLWDESDEKLRCVEFREAVEK